MDKNDISWKLIETYFNDNPNNLVAHHLESYNNFFNQGIFRIFRENNPIRFIEREQKDKNNREIEQRNECRLYLGGKDGKRIYFGKPIIYDEKQHYMYPNDARLRNMTYGFTIHYDVDVDYIYYVNGEKMEGNSTLSKIYLGKFPIMLQSDLCILNGLSTEVRFNMGECRNDYGGYFIIDGKEKVIVSQEKFANNMLYIRKNKPDNEFSYSAEIKSVSEDTSKQIRTTAVKMVAPGTYSNNQIVVDIPNVKKPVPLFILMRALGIISDKDIIRTCILDIEQNKSLVDLFIPSVHDASEIFDQETAIKYIASFTKRGTVSTVFEILSDYFLPHIGELNLLEKAYFIGHMTHKLLKVYTNQEKPTDRDSFLFKRVELSGALIYDLFREYYLIQNNNIRIKMEQEYYYHGGKYKDAELDPKDKEKKYAESDFTLLIDSNYKEFFKEKVVETGFRKAFKGNWGSVSYTKRIGVVQDLNRLSWNTHMSHLRKINLPLDASAKVVGPRHLNSSQWGFIDPVDTPDGGNIGLHKHLAISTYITSGFSAFPMIDWLRANTTMKLLLECSPEYIYSTTKIFINGYWIGVIDSPIDLINILKLYRRNGIIPVFTSISFQYSQNEINIFTDSGRLTRPVYYIENGKPSFSRKTVTELVMTEKITWEQIVSGLGKKPDFLFKANRLYDINELYSGDTEKILATLNENKSLVDYLDTSEEECSLISMNEEDIKKNRFYTHVEIEPSLMFGIMGNQIIFPEFNPFPRDVFSCGQSRQAVSMYHSNYQVRMDKTGVVLHYGQTPLIKSRYLEFINHEQQPYGVNAIVAIMSYTGYNVEDAILINEGSVNRGMFRTTYYSTYEDQEESDSVSGTINTKFANIEKNNVVGTKIGYEYNMLDDHGLIKENTEIHEKVILIGKIIANTDKKDEWIDSSVKTKKGQRGIVDKSFITEGEEGFNIAKVRIREERIPAIGDKMASRSGQKGTIGLIIPEEDMPFTSDGIRPDLIINPHAIPSRMTIGQIIEALLGKVCTSYGGFGDCTAYQTKGSNYSTYAPLLVNSGFHSTGNQILYNGMSGEQINADIFIGPTYYMRLKHMVKDKINYRATGPRTGLTRQPVQGRANDGGLRIGEMERDGVLAHGMSYFLNDSFMTRGDEYFMAVCNNTGGISIFNSSRNLFLSPFADGPIRFHTNHDGKTMSVMNITRFGRSFSILRIPYSFKLLIQELQIMNIQMRIITEDNIEQLMNMNYSNNIQKLLQVDEKDMSGIVQEFVKQVNNRKNTKDPEIPKEEAQLPDIRTGESGTPAPGPAPAPAPAPDSAPAPGPGSPGFPESSGSPMYIPGSAPGSPGSPYAPGSPMYPPGSAPASLDSAPSPVVQSPVQSSLPNAPVPIVQPLAPTESTVQPSVPSTTSAPSTTTVSSTTSVPSSTSTSSLPSSTSSTTSEPSPTSILNVPEEPPKPEENTDVSSGDSKKVIVTA
jgi:DNA-directed RNA polymerase II subunit RPB2